MSPHFKGQRTDEEGQQLLLSILVDPRHHHVEVAAWLVVVTEIHIQWLAGMSVQY